MNNNTEKYFEIKKAISLLKRFGCKEIILEDTNRFGYSNVQYLLDTINNSTYYDYISSAKLYKEELREIQIYGVKIRWEENNK